MKTFIKRLTSLAVASTVTGLLSFGFCHAAEGPKAFESADAAFKALLDGFGRNSDAAILEVLGQEGRDIVVQDDKEDAADVRKKICQCAKEHLQVMVDGDKAIAHLGLKDWPFPIPMIKRTEGWVFDAAAGKEEILNRRVGRNELHAIHMVDAFVDAQRAYALKDHTGNKVLKYAQKLISTKGTQDGLYWPVDEGSSEEISPLAPAFEDGDQFRDGKDVPYFGYYYKVLTKQGKNAPNGKYNYIINDNMVAGFAVIAWPANYGASGVMTFCVSQSGVIYQKDLGTDSAKIASGTDEYNPDDTWSEVNARDK
jgi:hypothetical protein